METILHDLGSWQFESQYFKIGHLHKRALF